MSVMYRLLALTNPRSTDWRPFGARTLNELTEAAQQKAKAELRAWHPVYRNRCLSSLALFGYSLEDFDRIGDDQARMWLKFIVLDGNALAVAHGTQGNELLERLAMLAEIMTKTGYFEIRIGDNDGFLFHQFAPFAMRVPREFFNEEEMTDDIAKFLVDRAVGCREGLAVRPGLPDPEAAATYYNQLMQIVEDTAFMVARGKIDRGQIGPLVQARAEQEANLILAQRQIENSFQMSADLDHLRVPVSELLVARRALQQPSERHVLGVQLTAAFADLGDDERTAAQGLGLAKQEVLVIHPWSKHLDETLIAMNEAVRTVDIPVAMLSSQSKDDDEGTAVFIGL